MYNYIMLQCRVSKSKTTKIPNSEENSKRKVPNQIANSKIQSHDNNCHILDVDIGKNGKDDLSDL